MKQVRIAVHNNHTNRIKLCEFNELQGELKELSKKAFSQLRKEILTTGFAFVPHVWRNPDDGKFYLVDGHQRVRVLRMLVEEGFHVPEVPVVEIEAQSMKEAKRRVLQGTSQYGQMTDQGLYEFASKAEISFDDLKDSFRFAEIDLNRFEDEYLNDLDDDQSITDIEHNDSFQLNDLRLVCSQNIKKSTKVDVMTVLVHKPENQYFMMEVSPTNCQIIIDRWEKFTGKKATKL